MKSWCDKIIHFLPFGLFGGAVLVKVIFLLTEFALSFAGNKKLLYDFQDSWMGRDEISGIIFFFAVFLSFIWTFLIFFFRCKHKLLWAIGFLFAPVIMFFIINLFPNRPDRFRREFNPRISCISSMKLIGYVLAMYAHDNNNYYPDDLKMISNYRKECGDALFRCPEVKAKGKEVFSDYIYHGKGKKASDPIFVLLEDKTENHRGNYKNRLMSDNDVIWGKKIE